MRGSEAAPATFEQSVSHDIGDHVEDDNDCDYQSYHEEKTKRRRKNRTDASERWMNCMHGKTHETYSDRRITSPTTNSLRLSV